MSENNPPRGGSSRDDEAHPDHADHSATNSAGEHQDSAEETGSEEIERNQAGPDPAPQGQSADGAAADSTSNVGSESDEQLAGEVSRLREALLRTRAEMDNLHKRAERELEKSRKFAVESLLRDLVPVIDSLDQGIEASGDSGTEGLELTRKLALDMLKRYGLEVVAPDGEIFDPQWHEAMSMAPSDDHESGQIITVLQRGYRLHDRVIRAARVIVAK